MYLCNVTAASQELQIKIRQWDVDTVYTGMFPAHLKAISICMVYNIKLQKQRDYFCVITDNLLDSILLLASVVQTRMPQQRL